MSVPVAGSRRFFWLPGERRCVCTSPAVALFVDYRAVLDPCFRGGPLSNEERNFTAIDFVRADDLGAFKENIIPIGPQLQIIRTAFRVNVLSSYLCVLVVVTIRNIRGLSRHY